MFADFKAFILRGNVVDLAIGVAIGAAFATLVGAFTTAIIKPLLALLGGGGNFDDKLTVTLRDTEFPLGVIVTGLVTFLLTAALLFFLVVKPVNALMARRKTEPDVDSLTKDCPECLSSIPVAASRCAFCTVEQ